MTSLKFADIPAFLYGTAWKKKQTAELVTQAYHAGFRGFDTACQPKHYDEALVGKALNALQQHGVSRSDYYLQTKFTPISGQDPDRLPYDYHVPIEVQIHQSFEKSLANLQTDYLDGWILHSPMESFEETLLVWNTMQSIYEEGAVRRLGISNCYQLNILEALYEQARIKPTIIQNRFYAATEYDRDIRAWCQQNNITYQSFWTLTANPHILESETLVTIAMRRRVSTAQILFAYLIQSGVTPLTGTTDIEHMTEDLQSLELTLSMLEISAIQTLFE